MDTLDLHGVRHHQVDEVIRRFLNYVPLPCQIITGNSQAMRSIVKNVVKEYEWFCYEKDSYNYGTLVIVEEKI
jgi:DNA-nicking Smr family endonuclease